MNSHQVFDWRRAYLQGKLEAGKRKPAALLPVVLSPAATNAVAADGSPAEETGVEPAAAMPGGVIHIELSGRAKIRVEGSVDRTLLRTVLESLLR